MIDRGEVDPSRNSFGMVFLDPTNPRGVTKLAKLILATIELGPRGTDYLPNAAAKADAHHRHGMPNGALLQEGNFSLGDGDFAWGHSARYGTAIGGGSGLSAEQDYNLTYATLEEVMTRVHNERQRFLSERRKQGKHGWFNAANMPPEQYVLCFAGPYRTPKRV